jgi:hypothetical protein
MQFLSTIVFSSVLVVAAGALMWLHRRHWNALQSENLPKGKFDFHRRQHYRRMMASALIGILGIAIFFGAGCFLGEDSFLIEMKNPLAIVVYWACVMLITLWITLIAFIDIISTRNYYARICEDDLLEQTKLHAELFRQQRERLKSQKPNSPPPTDES